KEFIRQGLGRAAAALSEKADIADFKPPVEGNDGSVFLQPLPCGLGSGVLLVPKEPAPDDRCIQNQRHGYLRPSSRQARISSIVAPLVCLRSSLILAMATNASARRPSSSRIKRTTGLPCRVITTVSPRSTSSIRS